MKDNQKSFTLPAISPFCRPQGLDDERGSIRVAACGFTLIELLVVVLIIGILAAVALPQYQKAVTKSRLANLKMIVEKVMDAAEVYYLANNTFPTTFEELDIDIPAPTSTEKKDGKFYAYYPWGSCQICKDSGQQFVNCRNDLSQISYTRYSETTTSYKVHRGCGGTKTNAIAIKVCQQETGSTTPYYTDSTVASYAYLE